MFYEAESNVTIRTYELQEDDYRWITYINSNSTSSPIVYLGTIDTDIYKGEVFKGLRDGEAMIVDLYDYKSLSDMKNEFLKNKSNGEVESKGKVVAHIEFDKLYSEVSEQFFLELMKNRNDGLDRELDYRKERDKVIKENKLLKKEISKFNRFQKKLSEFDWDSLY